MSLSDKKRKNTKIIILLSIVTACTASVFVFADLYNQEEIQRQELEKTNQTVYSNGTYNSVEIIKEMKKSLRPPE